MRQLLSQGSKIRLNILGWYQIVGGIVGILVTIWLLVRTGTVNGLAMLLFLLAFALYILSIYCGQLLLGEKYNRGLTLTNINQALQIVGFLFLGYGFFYISGLMALGSIAYDAGATGHGLKLGFNTGFYSEWYFDFAIADRSFYLSINFVAIYWLFFVDKLRRRATADLTTPEGEIVIASGADSSDVAQPEEN